MVYTEVLKRNEKKYYYRVKSVRKGKKVSKVKKYLGVNLTKKQLIEKEKKADQSLLYLQHLLTKDEIQFLERIKKEFAKEPKGNFANRYETFCALFTYNTNAIEGNTLTLQETAQLLFEDIVPRKSLREINEALNHKKAFDFLLEYKGDITKKFILDLHKIVVQNTIKKELEKQIGKYRTLQVYIRGVEFLPPKPGDVPKAMASLLRWYSNHKNSLHPLIVGAYVHVVFEAIHPFVDGNGRVGRLLMNFILYNNKFPMVNIPNSLRHEYYAALQDGQLRNNLRPFVELLLKVYKEMKIKF